MHAREKKALEHFAGGPCPAPRRVGGITLTNLLQKRLIIRTESAEDFGLPLYALTDKGREVLLALYSDK